MSGWSRATRTASCARPAMISAPSPSFPAAQQTRNNTTEYYARVSGHLVSLEGVLDQKVGLAYTRKRTLTLEPDFPGCCKHRRAHQD